MNKILFLMLSFISLTAIEEEQIFQHSCRVFLDYCINTTKQQREDAIVKLREIVMNAQHPRCIEAAQILIWHSLPREKEHQEFALECLRTYPSNPLFDMEKHLLFFQYGNDIDHKISRSYIIEATKDSKDIRTLMHLQALLAYSDDDQDLKHAILMKLI